jgi:hypothetical protein
MDDQFSEIINSCISTQRQNINGFYFFDCINKHWRIVTSSQWILTSFSFYFGDRWNTHLHKIIDSKKVTRKKADYLETIHIKDFNKIKV